MPTLLHPPAHLLRVLQRPFLLRPFSLPPPEPLHTVHHGHRFYRDAAGAARRLVWVIHDRRTRQQVPAGEVSSLFDAREASARAGGGTGAGSSAGGACRLPLALRPWLRSSRHPLPPSTLCLLRPPAPS